MDVGEALEFVACHGVVLVAARGPVPRLTEAIAGEEIRGSWWGHAKGREIYAVLEGVTSCDDVLVCRAVGGKVTLVHRRLWPALVSCATRIGAERLARVEQVHTPSGHHVNHELAFPEWVDAATLAAASRLREPEAAAMLGAWVAAAPAAPRRSRR